MKSSKNRLGDCLKPWGHSLPFPGPISSHQHSTLASSISNYLVSNLLFLQCVLESSLLGCGLHMYSVVFQFLPLGVSFPLRSSSCLFLTMNRVYLTSCDYSDCLPVFSQLGTPVLPIRHHMYNTSSLCTVHWPGTFESGQEHLVTRRCFIRKKTHQSYMNLTAVKTKIRWDLNIVLSYYPSPPFTFK